MTAWLASRCKCEKCEARRTEHPPLSDGCECPECQPGPGIHISKASRLDLALGEVIRVTCREWCLVCRDNVIIHAVKMERGWSNSCESGHTWHSFE
jgi:hypothetical protein